jgi:hypothetical protein
MQSITLSMPYDLTQQQWAVVDQVFRGMDGWIGYSEQDNCPEWFGHIDSPRYVTASVEPSGLLIEGNLSGGFWTGWLTVLCARLSLGLNMEIRDAEM